MAWKRICLPKRDGGLGIRSAGKMNKALLAKIAWRILKEDKSLWARVLRSKYKVGSIQDTSWTKVKSSWSSTWRSVNLGIREVVLPGLSWVLGDGSLIKFWKDKWLLQEPLMEMTTQDILAELADLRVRDLWQEGIGWDLTRIVPFIPSIVRYSLAAVVVDNVTGARDRMAWGPSADGKFTVKSAYSFLQWDPSPTTNMESLFNKVWKLTVPERIKVFLWLVVNQVIMKNTERHRRHLSDSGICQVCKGGEETILHVLRDCPAMSGI